MHNSQTHEADPDMVGYALRRFSIWEITRYMIPIAQGHLRRILHANPDLPQGTRTDPGSTRWFSLSDIGEIRRFLARSGRPGKARRGYVPARPAQTPACTVAVTGQTAAEARTTACLHLATRAALDGFRVLVVDLDPDRRLGGQLPPPRQESRMRGYSDLLARHFAEYLQQENRARMARGADPLPVNETLAEPLDRPVQALLRPSIWSGLDVLEGGADEWACGLRMTDWRLEAPGWPFWQALQDRLRDDGLLTAYDLVVIETPPVLDALALAALHLADHVLVPLRNTDRDAAAASAALAQITARFAAIETRLNTAARALGMAPVQLGQAKYDLLLSLCDDLPAGPGAVLQEGAHGTEVFPAPLPRTALMDGPGGFFAIDPRQMPRDRYVMARAPLERLWDEMRVRIEAGWRSAKTR